MMKKSGFIALLVIILASCGTRKGFKVEGTLDGGAGQKVYVDIIRMSSLEPVDSVVIDEKGHFMISGDLEQPSFAVLRSQQDAYITLILVPGDHVKITGPYNEMETSCTIEGSEDTEKFQKFLTHFRENITKLQVLNQTYKDSINSPNLNDIINDLDKKSRIILEDQKTYTRTFIDDNLNSLASLLVLYQQIAPRQYILDPMEDFSYFEKVDSALNSSYPKAGPVISFHTQMNDLRERKKQINEQEKNVGLGMVAPEIALPSPEGDTIRLSSTRGNYVLLDFWASWCSPCRKENPNLVKEYRKYHKKGFEIFQVSLDRDRENWLKGISEDHLGSWIHVSDLNYWQSSVVTLYHIQGIPMNFLLDKDGKIVGKNLRGAALSNKLEELFQ
ncbi:MAG: AhpC/TSA family protein [Chlorobi bacterium]|nr:AhpC/TSA family protein [Chlorobiota bacterium]